MQGQILNSRYRIMEYIAKGGFGKTYLAEDTQLPGKNKCVVKQLYPSIDDPNFIKIARRLFKTEAETLHHLGVHNQIPRLLAYFEEEEKFYLVQQYIEGHTLSQELEEGKPWTEAQVTELLKDCLNILEFVHSKHVIHRDVKPDNLIRRNSDQKLVLVDFGTVKEVIAEQTQLVPVTVAVGTRGYMPAEQARGIPHTASDIYALGVIAIQALTGVHPVQLPESDRGEIIWQERVQCSPQLREIIANMTRHHFKERYQSAAEVIAALNTIKVPQVAAAKYTPTVQLSGTQVANLADQPPTPNPSPTVARDPSVLATSRNLADFAPQVPSESFSVPEPSPRKEQPEQPAASNSMPTRQKSGRTLITLGAALAVGAIATGGMYLLNQRSAETAKLNQEQQVTQFNEMIAGQNYQDCYETAIKMKTQADLNSEAQMPTEQQQQFEAQCGLALAQAAATDLKYGEALAIAKTLPKDTPLQAEIKQQVDSWSEQLLQQATRVYQQEGNLEEAIELVKQIPENSAIKPQVIDAKNSWKTETATNEAILNSAEEALSQEKWLYAKQEATKIGESSRYWQQKAKVIIEQAEEGIAATAPAETEPVPDTKPVAPAPQPKTEAAPITKPVVPTPQPKIEPKPAPTPPEQLRDLGTDTAPEDLRDLNQNSTPSNAAPSDSMRDL